MNKSEQLKFIEDNYPLYRKHTSKRQIRHDIFSSIKTELQAYLLGFYASDGNINEKRKTLRIHLQQQDSEIVNLFKNIISPEARTFTVQEHKTTGRNKKIVNAHLSYGIDISSSKICNDLVDLGYGYKKSYNELKLPNLDNSLIIHFIRGYFDGDGTISGYVRYEIGKKPRVCMYFSLISKTKNILVEIQKFFHKYNINTNISFIKRDQLYRLITSSKEEVKKIYNLLYTNSYFYLNRKFSKFDYYVNTEVNQIISDHRNAQELSVNESNNIPKSAEHPLYKDENVC